ncbi:Translationally-controlled tumor protein like [Dendrobium catenatum]|uniref:Translationally-controlled tumor protein like n=1 Tax=Dendrobium catenatum TaxID=906689 RepID=A0A2I0VSU2_9ASPA|nr:Translationally-controlled tumor protein like [Dendrobium catenatum]
MSSSPFLPSCYFITYAIFITFHEANQDGNLQGKWVVQGAITVDIGSNPSADGADEGEVVDDQAIKVVDIVDTFHLQEQPAFDKKQFVTFMKRYIKNQTAKSDVEKQNLFKKHIESATKFLLSKLDNLQFFVGCMRMEVWSSLTTRKISKKHYRNLTSQAATFIKFEESETSSSQQEIAAPGTVPVPELPILHENILLNATAAAFIS